MPTFFSEAQKSLATAMLDRLIPRQGEHPGAGEIVVADYLDGAISASSQLRRLFSDGLIAVQAAAAALGSGFEDLDADTQDEILRAIEADHSQFFDRLVMLTYNGYYINPTVLESLGLEARPPQPKGHVVEAGDLSSLEAVMRRGQAYRDA